MTAAPMSDAELEGVHAAIAHYRADELIPRLLATIELLRADLAAVTA